MKNKKWMLILIIVGIIIAILCVCCSLREEDTNPFENNEKIENETDIVPFPSEDEDANKVDSEQSTKDNVTNSDETIDSDKQDSENGRTNDNEQNSENNSTNDNEQDSESDNTIEGGSTELPFVPFD